MFLEKEKEKICLEFIKMNIEDALEYLYREAKKHDLVVSYFVNILKKYSYTKEELQEFEKKLLLARKVKTEYICYIKDRINEIKNGEKVSFGNTGILKNKFEEYVDLYEQIYPEDKQYVIQLKEKYYSRKYNSLEKELPNIYNKFMTLELKVGKNTILEFTEPIALKYSITSKRLIEYILEYASIHGNKKNVSEKIRLNIRYNASNIILIHSLLDKIKNGEKIEGENYPIFSKEFKSFESLFPERSNEICELKQRLQNEKKSLENHVCFHQYLEIKDYSVIEKRLGNQKTFKFIEAISIVNYLLDSNCTLIEFCHKNKDFNYMEISNILDWLKSYLPNYMKEIIKRLDRKPVEGFKRSMENLVYEILNSDMDIIDYYLQTNLSGYDFLRYIECMPLNDQQFTKIKKFLSYNRIINANYMLERKVIWEAMQSKTIMNGICIPTEDKKQIIEYLQNNQIPINQYTYYTLLKKVVQQKNIVCNQYKIEKNN